MIGRIASTELDLARASDVAGDIQRAEQAPVDRPEHHEAVRAGGGRLDGAGDLGPVERTCDEVGDLVAGRTDLQVAAEGHVAAKEEHGAIGGDDERGRADTERTAGGERVGTEDHTALGERGRPLVGVIAPEEERTWTDLD